MWLLILALVALGFAGGMAFSSFVFLLLLVAAILAILETFARPAA